MKRRQWLKPVLATQVKFTEWTHDSQLRQPVFLGLRIDKEAKDVVRE
jgi:bifunctional non-homologous end joining protein LigD